MQQLIQSVFSPDVTEQLDASSPDATINPDATADPDILVTTADVSLHDGPDNRISYSTFIWTSTHDRK
jgi:hypothetical protein